MRFFHAVLVVVTLTFAGVVAAHALDSADLPKAIENAKTPADHEAIAAYFDEQAKEARATADMHRQMGGAYRKRPPTSPKGGGSDTFGTRMRGHCEDLVSKYEQVAKDDEAMAAAHRAEAKATR
jgi:hypothetical protein